MRIGAIHNDDGRANAYYRAVLPLRALQQRGHDVVWPAQGSVRTMHAGRPNWDVAHVYQLVGDEHLEAVERLRARGIAVVWDTDDDISTIPRKSPAYRRLGGRRGVRRHAESSHEIARAAHLMTTPSTHLAEMYAKAGAEHTLVLENFLGGDDVRASARRRRRPGVAIGITCGFEHADDLKKLKIPRTLQALLERHANVQVIAFGLDLRLGGPRYTHRLHVPIRELVREESAFDIGLAPLHDSPLSRARSNVKLKEYAAAGAAWLASPVGPYRGLGEDEGGQLVEDGTWDAALERTIVDPAFRASLAERARAWAARQSIDAAAKSWEVALRAASLRAKRSHSN